MCDTHAHKARCRVTRKRQRHTAVFMEVIMIQHVQAHFFLASYTDRGAMQEVVELIWGNATTLFASLFYVDVQ